jgi:hypothetical protein
MHTDTLAHPHTQIHTRTTCGIGSGISVICARAASDRASSADVVFTPNHPRTTDDADGVREAFVGAFAGVAGPGADVGAGAPKRTSRAARQTIGRHAG